MRSYIAIRWLAAALCVLAFACSSSNKSGGSDDAGSDKGSGGKASSNAGKSGGTGGASHTGTGGHSATGGQGSAETDAGEEDAGGGNAGNDCTGKDGCYSCAPKNDTQFLSACTDAQCEPFDNVKRLPSSYKPGEALPSIP